MTKSLTATRRPSVAVSSAQTFPHINLSDHLLAKYDAQGWTFGALRINPWN